MQTSVGANTATRHQSQFDDAASTPVLQHMPGQHTVKPLQLPRPWNIAVVAAEAAQGEPMGASQSKSTHFVLLDLVASFHCHA